ncbi:methyltransferase family protein [Muricomes intestini]|uniref:Methyltransferase family protein n=1 Tax=Muricomes intestini TaxID=1796634 RepID=A0A4R3KG92_9FIRM|nr:class I SAM-dependent methyltransferase [Muricomes intestini]TCS82426.1 methyltransferase family protein [Muricomes intestini]
MSTLDYYNEHAHDFIANTVSADFQSIQAKFLSYLIPGVEILDFGCGSGRDAKYFMEHGYHVTAIDGSAELCRLASEYTGLTVNQMMFQELSDVNIYDAVWACSSILHLPYQELKQVLEKIEKALKPRGVLYTSFKYGTFEGERNGRYFTDMTEESFEEMLQGIKNLAVEEQWITSDVRSGRSEEKWLNSILRKM